MTNASLLAARIIYFFGERLECYEKKADILCRNVKSRETADPFCRRDPTILFWRK